MTPERKIPRTGSYSVIILAFLILSLTASPSVGADGISPDAERILRSMSSYMEETKAFKMNVDVDFEIVTKNGQKLQFSSVVSAIIKRPGQFHITRKGMVIDLEYIFDGEIMTLYGKNLNAYSQIERTGTIDDAFHALEYETGFPAPGADLFFSDSFTTLSSDVESGVYIGTAYVNGVKCHHLAFRKADVDWQLWVKSGDQPLPMKYVITTKWVTGAPQYEIRLRDWEINPKIEAGRFSFSAPSGSTKLASMPIEELDEITFVVEGK